MNLSNIRTQLLIALCLTPGFMHADESKFPCPDDQIARYTAHHVHEAITIDGRLNEKAWRLAPRSPIA